MATQIKKGTITARTTTGSQAYTGVGFQPTAVIFWGSKQTADGVAAAGSLFYGVAANNAGTLQQWALAVASDDAAAVSNAGRNSDTNACVKVLANGTPTADAEASLTSMDADGFTLNWTDAAPTAWVIHYLAIGGDVTRAAAGRLDGAAATGNQAITGLGFRPAAMMFGSVLDTTQDALTTQANLNIGFASSPTFRGTAGWRDRDAIASGAARDGASAQVTDKVLNGISSTTATIVAAADLASFDADGFTLNWTTAASGVDLFYLAVLGGTHQVVNDNQRTSTGTQAMSGLGLSPRGLVMASWNKAASAAVDAGSPQLTIAGAGSQGGLAQGMASLRANDAQTTASDLDSRHLTNGVLGAIAANAQTVLATGAVQSLDADGYTVNWTAADATARQFLVWAIGDNPPQTVAPNAVASPARVGEPWVARAGDPASGSAIFTDEFAYPDGDLSVVASSAWGSPVWVGQNPIRVLSGKAARAAAASWADVYTLTSSFGDGDYLYKLAAPPDTGNVLFLHALLTREADGGVDGYTIRLAPTSFRLSRIDNGAFTVLSGADYTWTAAGGDEFVIRRDAGTWSVYVRTAGGTWNTAYSGIVDTTYTTGRVGLETDAPSARVEGVGVFSLPNPSQTVAPNGVASPASVGAPTVTPGAVTVVPSAVASPASVGAPTVTPGAVTVAPSAVASPASVGAPQVTQEVQPAAVASPSSVGAPAVAPGPVTVVPNGVASPAAVGQPAVAPGDVTIRPGRQVAADSFPYPDGSLVGLGDWGPTVWGDANATVASGQAASGLPDGGWAGADLATRYGYGSVSFTVAAPSTGSNQVEVYHLIDAPAKTMATVGFDVDEVYLGRYIAGAWTRLATANLAVQAGDRFTLDVDATDARVYRNGQFLLTAAHGLTNPTGRVGFDTQSSTVRLDEFVVVEAQPVASPATVGQPDVLLGAVVVNPNPVASPATVGAPTVIGDQTIAPAAVPSPATVGQPGLVYDQAVTPNPVASPATVGQPAVAPPAAVVAPNAVASPASVGQPVVTPGPATVAPNTVASPATVGAPTVRPDQFIIPTPVASPATVGAPDVAGTVTHVVPLPVASPATVGLPAVSRGRNPRIYARGPRDLTGDVRLKIADGTWVEVGKGVARGITVEGLSVTANRKGPDTASFTLRRDPTRPWLDLGPLAEGEVVIAGERVWAGRLKEAPGSTGADQQIAFSGEAWQYHLDDDLQRVGFVHQRLGDWSDVRQVPGVVGTWVQPPTVSTDEGRIVIGYPNDTPYAVSTAVGVRLDLGEFQSRAEEVAVECIASNPNAFATVFVRGSNVPDPLAAGLTAGVDYDDYTTLGFASVSADEAVPTLIRGVLSPGYRYVTVFLWGAAGSGTTGLDHMLKINRIAVASSLAYLDDTTGKSQLKASDVVSYLVQSGRHGPLLSRSIDEVETTGLIDGGTAGIPHYWPDASSPRELLDGVNAFHDYQLGVDPDRRVFFKAPPSVPDLEVGSWAGADFNDASASSAADVYTKVVGQATGVDGQPIEVTRYAVQASPELVDRSDVPLLSNPTFTTDTAGWGVLAGSMVRVTTSTYDGGGALQVSPPVGGSTAIVEANLTGLTAGHTYAIKIPAKMSAVAPEHGFVWWAEARSGTGVVLDRITQDESPTATYREFYLTFTADSATAKLQVGATFPTPPPGTPSAFTIDGLRSWLVEVNAADRAGAPRAIRIPIGAVMTRAALETLLDVWLRNHLTTPLKGSLRVVGQGGVRRFRGGAGVAAHELLLYPGRILWLSNVEDPDSGSWGRTGTIASVTYTHDDRSASVEIDNERGRFDTYVSRIASLVDQVR